MGNIQKKHYKDIMGILRWKKAAPQTPKPRSPVFFWSLSVSANMITTKASGLKNKTKH